MKVTMVGTTSADNGTSCPVDFVILTDTTSIHFCNDLLAPKDNRLIFLNLHGINAKSPTNFSVRKDWYNPLSNSIVRSKGSC